MRTKFRSITLFWWLFGAIIVFLIACKNKYFALGNFVVPLIITVVVGFMQTYGKIKLTFLNKLLLISIINVCVVAGLNYSTMNVSYALSWLALYIVTLLSTTLPLPHEKCILLIDCYIISGLIICLFAIIDPQYYEGRLSVKFFDGPVMDVNYLAFFMIEVIFLTLYKIKRYSLSYYNKWFCIFCIAIFSIFTLSTGSRSGLVCLAILAASFFADYCLTGKISAIKIIKILLITFAAMAAGVFLIRKYVSVEILNRFFNRSWMDFSNINRLTRFKIGFETAMEHPIKGYGLVTSIQAIIKAGKAELSAHNTFLSAWISLGLVGLVLLLLLLLYVAYKAWKSKNIIVLGGIGTIFFSAMLLEVEISATFWLTLIVIIKILEDPIGECCNE